MTILYRRFEEKMMKNTREADVLAGKFLLFLNL